MKLHTLFHVLVVFNFTCQSLFIIYFFHQRILDNGTPERFNGAEEYVLHNQETQVLHNCSGHTHEDNTNVQPTTSHKLEVDAPLSSSSERVLGNAYKKNNDEEEYETAIIISTHLIPSHPSLDILNETMESLKFINGLPKNSQIIITVDGLNEDNSENRQEYQLLMSNEHREKLESYLAALYKAYSRYPNVKIVVAGTHIHLGRNIKKALDLLDPRTEYVYILQQDLPFIREINHTAILQTVRQYPDVVRLIRFNNRPNRVLRNIPCWNQTDAVQHVNGIHLHKTSQWSDMNHFTRLDFYRKHILSVVNLDNFPERTMMRLASKNCSFYGPHMYGQPKENPYVKHTDGGERYGKKLKARIASGDIKREDLKESTIREENIML